MVRHTIFHKHSLLASSTRLHSLMLGQHIDEIHVFDLPIHTMSSWDIPDFLIFNTSSNSALFPLRVQTV